MDVSVLSSSALFRGMDGEEVRRVLAALRAREREYQKGETILHAGDTTEEMGLVLSGSVTVENNGLWGSRTILTLAERGDFFAEAYAVLGQEPLLIDVRANEDCRILFLRIGAGPGEGGGLWYLKLVQNLLLIASRKNLVLSGRAFHTAPKTIRGRVMAYLDSVSLQKRSREFDIPFDRQQMADYLNVERTALSKELGKMKKDGMLEYRGRHFRLHASRLS